MSRRRRTGAAPRTARARTAGLVTAALLGSLLAGCTGGGGGSDDDGGSGRPSRSPDESARPPGPVLAVKIDNVAPARPQAGLDTADVVYAEQVEGGLSRLMAVYASRWPESVGPVRSARESDLELLRQFHDPTLAFSGAQHKLLPLIDKAPLRAATPESEPDAFYRATGRSAPHDLFLHPRELMGSAPGADALTNGFRFGAAPSGGTPESARTVRFPAARFTFTWSGDRERWLVSTDGRPTVNPEGDRVAPATVVVQYVSVHDSTFHDYLGSATPYTETVGAGRAQVLRDGRSYEGHWKRDTATQGTKFTTPEGAPLNFAKGQVWVVLAQKP
ncbi:DUF3048 domain-containing protein [Streptomyces sp. C1-2]|uniref:DUF3048 domain-containing protein n=1 Tax=Streptomyces sp. C1-2 TaxID=2720022 RepID=UPI00143238E7|nr:DUF3048 domain-containing protein [Streptomyces sp. C1-2]NJP71967.1 DUF3048 domain-containing protein [Streptomyces sp. C1-2]